MDLDNVTAAEPDVRPAAASAPDVPDRPTMDPEVGVPPNLVQSDMSLKSNDSNISLTSSAAIGDHEKKLFEWKETYNAWKRFNEFRKNNLYCDLELKITDVIFRCHRAILSACCPYFESLLSDRWRHGRDGPVKLPGISPDMMEILLTYIYTREVKISSDNVVELLPAADQFGVLGITKKCRDFLREALCPENCIGIRNFAIQNSQYDLVETVQAYILANFTQISDKSEEFLEITPDLLFEFLASDELNVKSEEVAFEMMIRWVEHDVDFRKEAMTRILKTVRMGLMDPDFFMTKVKSHKLMKDNPEVRPIIKEAMKALYDLSSYSATSRVGQPAKVSPYIRPRLPNEILFAVGGWSGGSPTNVIETYDCRAESWVDISSWPVLQEERPRAYHGLAAHDKFIYIVGGFDGQNYFNSMRKLDLTNTKLTEEAPMKHRRCYVSCTTLGHEIYALGGMDGQKRLASCEVYDCKKKRWSILADMSQKRSDADSSAANNKVYVAGGFNGHECLNSTEFYDKASAQWTRVTPMRSKRSGVSLITLNDKIFAVGGFDGTNRLRSAEYYNDDENAWVPVANMINPRSNFGVEVIDGQIIAVGGFNGFQTTFNVEAYDSSTDEWYELRDMHVFRSALSCCVIKGLPMKHLKRYAAPRVTRAPGKID